VPLTRLFSSVVFQTGQDLQKRQKTLPMRVIYRLENFETGEVARS
jgi:hypothetical protein